MSDPMFDDEMAEYVDEEEVRRLLNDLGYKNPSREAIEQTIIETRKVFRQQRALLDDQEGDNIDDIVESNQQNDNYWRRSAGDGQLADRARTTANNPVDVSGLQTDTSEGDAGGSQHDEWIRSQHQRMPPPQRMPHFLAAEKMDESDLGADFPSHRQYRGNPSPGDEAISAAGRTTSTPAHAVGRTPTSNNQNQRQVRKAPDNRNAVHTDQRPHNQAAITIPSSTSSRPSSVAARRNPYHRRSEDPQHLQHFAPYLNLMQSEAQHSFERKSLGKLPDQNQFSPRTTSNVQSTSKPSPTPRPSTAASMRSNVIYAFTGDRNYRPRVLTPAGAQARPVARHSDPVTRGAQMRQVWKKDDFLSQRGRKEERWEVRRSMLSWEGQ